MKIGWLQDLEFLHTDGGAQMTDRAHYYEGVRRGHEMHAIIGATGGANMAQPFDGFIISNAMSFRMEVFGEIRKVGAPYVIFAHDYICRWRLHYAQQPKCKQCYLRERWLPILQEARLMIWLSPLHRRGWLFNYPELKTKPYILVPSPVSPKEFYPLGKERKGAAAINSHLGFKGRENLIGWAKTHPDVQVDLVGSNEALEGLPPNIAYKGAMAPVAMNAWLNEHEALVHLPVTWQPFERVVAEAYLAGCRIIGNGAVGALSYPWFKSRELVAQHCAEAPRRFWEAVEKALA